MGAEEVEEEEQDGNLGQGQEAIVKNRAGQFKLRQGSRWEFVGGSR